MLTEATAAICDFSEKKLPNVQCHPEATLMGLSIVHFRSKFVLDKNPFSFKRATLCHCVAIFMYTNTSSGDRHPIRRPSILKAIIT